MNSHEGDHPEIISPAEQTVQTVERFLESSRGVLLNMDHDLGVKWQDQVDRLFGNEELFQVAKENAYLGIPGARSYLISEYERGGLLGLELAFFSRVHDYTKDTQMPEAAVRTAFKKIFDHK